MVTMREAGGTRAGRVEDGEVVALPWADVGELMASSPSWFEEAARTDGPRFELSQVELAAAVPGPSKVLCLGLNYADHVAEMGYEQPRWPTVFAKFADSLTGPYDDLVLPAESDQVDWEVELGVVVGRACRRVSVEEARDHIGGLTVVNDISMRDWQLRSRQFLQGKMWEACTPVGPAVVTPDELDGGGDLALSCSVDGQVMQRGRTSDLIFGLAEIVSYLSTVTTLRPGDLISTGTPSGVGASRHPKAFLHAGQVLRTTIEGIGTMVNRCR